jgi:hypothetical protein
VRLLPAQYVKPYVQTNKSDYLDAEAIAEAVQRPRMRFVPIKTEEQLLSNAEYSDVSSCRNAHFERVWDSKTVTILCCPQ